MLKDWVVDSVWFGMPLETEFRARAKTWTINTTTHCCFDNGTGEWNIIAQIINVCIGNVECPFDFSAWVQNKTGHHLLFWLQVKNADRSR
jgi:hypothetical protein